MKMFYTTIVELPFFEQFEISNKEQFIDQLSNFCFKYS